MLNGNLSKVECVKVAVDMDSILMESKPTFFKSLLGAKIRLKDKNVSVLQDLYSRGFDLVFLSEKLTEKEMEEALDRYFLPSTFVHKIFYCIAEITPFVSTCDCIITDNAILKYILGEGALTLYEVRDILWRGGC